MKTFVAIAVFFFAGSQALSLTRPVPVEDIQTPGLRPLPIPSVPELEALPGTPGESVVVRPLPIPVVPETEDACVEAEDSPINPLPLPEVDIVVPEEEEVVPEVEACEVVEDSEVSQVVRPLPLPVAPVVPEMQVLPVIPAL